MKNGGLNSNIAWAQIPTKQRLQLEWHIEFQHHLRFEFLYSQVSISLIPKQIAALIRTSISDSNPNLSHRPCLSLGPLQLKIRIRIHI